MSSNPSPAPQIAEHAFCASSASWMLVAAEALFKALSRGQRLNAQLLRHVMTTACGGSDAAGAWNWHMAYDACEVASLLFLKRYLPALRAKTQDSSDLFPRLKKLTELLPTHTKRSEDGQAFQQFSTPIPYAVILADAAAISQHDLVLEPSAGTGQLAIHAVLAGAHVHLNELEPSRADLLAALFPDLAITRHNAEHIDDLLDPAVRPTVIIMNPPFSASPHVQGPLRGCDCLHVRSALRRLAPGGRLVAITSDAFAPNNPAYRDAFAELSSMATLRLSAPVAGQLYGQHGTTVTTRLSVFDKIPAEVSRTAQTSGEAMTWQSLLTEVHTNVPPRLPCAVQPVRISTPHTTPALAPTLKQSPLPTSKLPATTAPLDYEPIADALPRMNATDALYEPYAPERIHIPGAHPHPTKLVQSAAMASVLPPLPTYRPTLPGRIVTDGLLSAPQLESVIYAGEAHSKLLTGHWRVSADGQALDAAPANDGLAVQFRRGFFLGDGTGAGKGRQVAGIILDNWLQGRRKALWISKSDKLLEDAQRDWSALAQEKLLVVPQSRYQQGKPITLPEGILFTTYATLRSAEREGKASRLEQIKQWLGEDFDGVIIFDEAHAMANAAPTNGTRGTVKGSQQGVAGLILQHALPLARVVYVSATGATTIENLAYAQRLGLWGSDDLPFENRGAFVSAMQEGGIASSEVLARDLKALGLYVARSLSYDGVEVDILEHALTAPQRAIYDAYAQAYQVIHANLTRALEITNITGTEGGTYNSAAKAAARSAFESSKQRFFNHLITAMKVPSLITSMTDDLASGRAVVVQLVSTSEALMERRLAQIPPSQWNDLDVDVTPREYVLDYLHHSFPTQLFELHSDDEGNLVSVPVYADGHPVICREAEERRDALIEHLGALPAVQSALDQIIHHFGTDEVAEVTGRNRRIVRKTTSGGSVLMVQNRSASANLAETQAFMDDTKRILVFSDAGGTGRSYHADLACRNQRKRVHYLLEAGWKADTAIQGLGRTNRTNQKFPPLFRPVATDVRGEKRFISTIARRLDSLGAITRGQRQTGGQGMFRASDNLESHYARSALRNLYSLLHAGRVECCSLCTFQDMTGLELVDADGSLREDLPQIHTFLNRVLALPIALQNELFVTFEALIQTRVESAIAAGTYEIGLETIRAHSLQVIDRHTVATHASGGTTMLVNIRRRDRSNPPSLDDVLAYARDRDGILLLNCKSRRAAVQCEAPSWTLEDGTVEPRVRLIRPLERHNHRLADLAESSWQSCDQKTFAEAWRAELANVPEYVDTVMPIVTGLLLPIWKTLPFENPRIFRLCTDDGEAILGRLVPPDHIERFTATPVTLTPSQAWDYLQAGKSVPLGHQMRLKPALVMNARRLELIGYEPSALPRLKALGLFSEIIAWKTRLFVPNGVEGPMVLTALMQRYGVQPKAA